MGRVCVGRAERREARHVICLPDDPSGFVPQPDLPADRARREVLSSRPYPHPQRACSLPNPSPTPNPSARRSRVPGESTAMAGNVGAEAKRDVAIATADPR